MSLIKKLLTRKQRYLLLGGLSGFTIGVSVGSISRTKEIQEPLAQKGVTNPALGLGVPLSTSLRVLNDRSVVLYDRQRKNPFYVLEHLTRKDISYEDDSEKADRSLCSFTEDEGESVHYRALLSDYVNSGFDRGHLAAAANYRCDQADMCKTFHLVNVAPQNRTLNRTTWLQLEKLARKLTKSHDDVYVASGPLYLPTQASKNARNSNAFSAKLTVIGEEKTHVVPSHFFKIIVAQKNNKAHVAAFLVPNSSKHAKTGASLAHLAVDKHTIDKLTGFVFFPKLGGQQTEVLKIAPRQHADGPKTAPKQHTDTPKIAPE